MGDTLNTRILAMGAAAEKVYGTSKGHHLVR